MCCGMASRCWACEKGFRWLSSNPPWPSTPTFWPATPPTDCGSFGRCGTGRCCGCLCSAANAKGIDLFKVVLTHHNLRIQGMAPMPLIAGANPKLEPITEAGSGSVQEKQKARLDEIIQRVNDLFEGDLTDQDKLVYVNNVIMGKLLESETLKQQATNNTKEQFANSPDLKSELMNAIIGALKLTPR